MKVYIDCDERYPDYSLDKAEGHWKEKQPQYKATEISEEFYERYLKACAEYQEVQSIIEKLEEN